MDTELESRYLKLERPEFHSSIPLHLVDKLSPSEKYLVESVSIIEQTQKFLVLGILETNRAVREIDERLQIIESWKSNLLSKWAIFAGLGMILIPVLIERIIVYALGN